MFNSSQYLIAEQDDMRYVVRVVSKTPTHYTIERPLFVCWGSTFKRWGQVSTVTKKYVERKFKVMPDELAAKYKAIQQNQPSSFLF